MEQQKAVITVIGNDQVGIIARVCTILAEEKVNILDITQTIVGGFFNMAMVVDVSEANLDKVSSDLENLGSGMGLKIRVQNAKIFDAMHRI